MRDFITRTSDGEETVDFRLLESMMEFLETYENTRTLVYVLLRTEISDDNTGEVSVETVPQRPHNIYSGLTKYQETLLNFKLYWYQVREVPVEGACDTRPHEIAMKFESDGDKILELKVQTVKSTGDNCLINAMS